jgi:hypothetical protein
VSNVELGRDARLLLLYEESVCTCFGSATHLPAPQPSVNATLSPSKHSFNAQTYLHIHPLTNHRIRLLNMSYSYLEWLKGCRFEQEFFCLMVLIFTLDCILDLSWPYVATVRYILTKVMGNNLVTTILVGFFYGISLDLFCFWMPILLVGGLQQQRPRSLLEDQCWKDLEPVAWERRYVLTMLEFRIAIQQIKLLPGMWKEMRDNYHTVICELIQEDLMVEARPIPATRLRISHTTASRLRVLKRHLKRQRSIQDLESGRYITPARQ